jgi:hypothetical protein
MAETSPQFLLIPGRPHQAWFTSNLNYQQPVSTPVNPPSGQQALTPVQSSSGSTDAVTNYQDYVAFNFTPYPDNDSTNSTHRERGVYFDVSHAFSRWPSSLRGSGPTLSIGADEFDTANLLPEKYYYMTSMGWRQNFFRHDFGPVTGSFVTTAETSVGFTMDAQNLNNYPFPIDRLQIGAQLTGGLELCLKDTVCATFSAGIKSQTNLNSDTPPTTIPVVGITLMAPQRHKK